MSTQHTLTIPLPNFHFYRYRFSLQLIEEVMLPKFLGNMLRGGFGLTFKHMVCMQKHLAQCGDCTLRQTCAYPFVFEPAPPPDAKVLRGHERIPSPFVFKPPPGREQSWEAGEQLDFEVNLFGRGADYLPYFALAFQRLGERGLHFRRGTAELKTIHAISPIQTTTNTATSANTIYLQPIWVNQQLQPDWALFGKWSPEQVVRCFTDSNSYTNVEQSQTICHQLPLTFHTPTALKHNGRILQGAPPFHVLIRTLLRRVSSLSYFYGGAQWAIDYRGWIERAEAVDVAEAATHWVNRSRYSTRQQQRTDLSGIVGRVTYRGEIAPFFPLLRLGALIHVGKNAVFGNGRYGIG